MSMHPFNRKKPVMTRFRYGGLLTGNIGEVTSTQVGQHTLRREVSVVDSVRFYRFTLNPGLSTEFGTFWNEDEKELLRLVYRKAGIPLT